MTIEITLVDVIIRIFAGLCGIATFILLLHERHQLRKFYKQ